jgi:hypothetical protein
MELFMDFRVLTIIRVIRDNFARGFQTETPDRRTEEERTASGENS